MPWNVIHQEQGSEELQALGRFGDRVKWIAGLYYFSEHGSDNSAGDNLVPPTTAHPNFTLGTAENKSYAAYTQADVQITSKLKATLGIRYSKDQRKLTLYNYAGGTGTCLIAVALRVAPTVCQVDMPKLTNHYVPWTAGLQYEPTENAMVYAKVSRGFRSGGYNMRGAVQNTKGFGPEKVTSYEIGEKVELFNRRLRINADVYDAEYSQIQIIVRQGVGANNTPLQFAENAGDARIRGAELEAQALVTDHLTLSVSGGITHPRYTKLQPGSTTQLTDHFVFSPRTNYSLAADYRAPTDWGQVNAHVDYGWRSQIYFSQTPVAVQPAFGLLNAQLSFQLASMPGLELGIWGRNLGAKKYFTDILALLTPHGAAAGWPGDPRTYGVSVSYRFGDLR